MSKETIEYLWRKPTLEEVQHVAKAIAEVDGYRWKFLKDVENNPSTADDYRRILRMARAAIRAVRKNGI
jgi:preprotein translocase subunit Sss1